MTVIGYLTRAHFAEAAIEDALPEEVRRSARVLVLVDEEPNAGATLTRVQDVLDVAVLSTVKAPRSAPRREAASAIIEALEDTRAELLIAVGGTTAIGQSRLVAELLRRKGSRCSLLTIPSTLCDFGLARHVRPEDGSAMACPRPERVIVDPTVLEHVPPRRLSAGAMEVLVHAIEAYASPGFNPPADALAEDAVRRMTRWLPAAVEAPDSREAHRELMAAALNAGLALEKAVGGVDALAHAIEVERGEDVLHGALHGPLLAAMAEFNAEAVGDRYAALACAFPRARGEPSIGVEIGHFARALGMPTHLREIGINAARFERIAEIAANDPAALANPRRLTPGDCRRILEAAW